MRHDHIWHPRRKQSTFYTERSVKHYLELLPTAPDDIDLLLGLASHYIDDGQETEAAKIYTRIVGLEPKCLRALHGLGECHLITAYEEGTIALEVDEIVRKLSRVTELGDSSTPRSASHNLAGAAWKLMGHAYFLSAQYNESANVFLKIQEPDLSDVPLELPLSLAKTGRHEQAAIYFEKTWLNDVNYPGIVLDRDISKDDVPHLLLYLCSLEKSKLWERARQVRAALRFLDPTLIVEPALPLKFVQGWSRLKLKEKIFAHERYSFDTGKVYSYQDIAPAVQKIMGVTGWWWDDQMLKEYQSMDARVLETFGVDNEEIQKMLSDYQIQIDAYFEQNNLNL